MNLHFMQTVATVQVVRELPLSEKSEEERAIRWFGWDHRVARNRTAV